jgi:LPXTG-site transpeptidase (sortase) family protein
MQQEGFFNRNLRYINWCLVALIILINGYLLAAPLWPRFELWKRQRQTAAVAGLPYKTHLIKSSPGNGQRDPIPSDNRLVIPKIAINEHIYAGTNAHLVNQGVWDKTQTSIPPKGGNTVMVAHRFTYDGPATFYSLDKLSSGDKIVVYWQGKEYDYTVKTNKIVNATELSVEKPTKDSILTLYTCTPLWTANPKYRIVVTASLDGQS